MPVIIVVIIILEGPLPRWPGSDGVESYAPDDVQVRMVSIYTSVNDGDVSAGAGALEFLELSPPIADFGIQGRFDSS